MPWTHGQNHQNSSFSSGSSFGQTITAVTSGDIITISVLTAGAAPSTLSVTDNKSNTYTAVGTGATANNNFLLFQSGLITNGPTTVTVNSTGTWTAIVTALDEWTPPTGATGITQDGNHYDTGFTASQSVVNGTSFTTALNGDILISYSNSNSSIVQTGWTATTGATTANTVGEWQIQSSAGATPATSIWSESGSYNIGTFALNATLTAATPDIGGSAAIYRVQVPGWRWRAPPKGYARRNGLLLKAA